MLHIWGRLSSRNLRKVVWESNVIVRCLCSRHAPAPYPQDLAQRFDAERWYADILARPLS